MKLYFPLSNVLAVVLAALLTAFLGAGCSEEKQKVRVAERAQRFFEGEQYDEAKIEYANLLRMDPENAVAHANMGIMWHQEGSPIRAIPYLLRARQTDPEFLPARAALALSFSSVGNVEEARKEAEEILARSPAHEEALLLLADTSSTAEEIESVEARLDELEGEGGAVGHLAKAALALRNRDLVGAEREVVRALELDSELTMAHVAMGQLHVARKEIGKARDEFRIAADLAPLRSSARLKYAMFMMQSGDVGGAKAFLQDLTDKAPDYMTAWTMRAQIEVAEKNYKKGLELLENIFSRDVMNYEARLLQAQIFLTQRNGTEVVRILTPLAKSYPGSPIVQIQLARGHLLNADPDQAGEAVKEALRLNPKFADAILLDAGLRLMRGESEEVVGSMTDFLTSNPNNSQARSLLADAYQALGRLEEATTLYRAQVAEDPTNFRSHFVLGLVLKRQEKLSEARDAFEEALQKSPGEISVIYQLIEMDIAEEEFDAAEVRVRSVLETSPDSPEVHFLEGRIHIGRAEWELAEVSLKRALELKDDYMAAYNDLIALYIATGRLSEAASQIEQGLARKPGNISALMMSALIYDAIGEKDKVEDSYLRVLSENPSFMPALNNLAYLYAGKPDRIDEAHKLALKARALQPGDPALADTLGWILFQKGDYQQAMALLGESAAGLPENPEIQYHLGMTFYMMGKTEKAKAAFEEAVAAEKAFPGKEDAQLRLALLSDVAAGGQRHSLQAMEEMIVERPDDLLLRMRMGKVYEEEGRNREASELYEGVLEMNSQFSDAAKGLARLYAGPLNDKEKAIEFAKEARRLVPLDPGVAGLLGTLAYESGDIAWGYGLLSESVAKLPDDPVILNSLAWAAYRLGKGADSIDTMRRVLEASPEAALAEDARNFIALTSALKAGPEEVALVEEAANATLKRNAGHVPALMVKASLESQRGQAAAAAVSYEAILEGSPDFAPAQKELAALYAEDPEKLTRANDLAASAREVLSGDLELTRTLAEISFKRGEYVYALQLLGEIARKDTLDAEGLYYRGVSELRLGHQGEGEEVLEEAIAAGLRDPMLSEARKALSKVERGATQE